MKRKPCWRIVIVIFSILPRAGLKQISKEFWPWENRCVHQEPRPSSWPVRDVTNKFTCEKCDKKLTCEKCDKKLPNPQQGKVKQEMRNCLVLHYLCGNPNTSATSIAPFPEVSECEETAQNWLPEESSPVNTWLAWKPNLQLWRIKYFQTSCPSDSERETPRGKARELSGHDTERPEYKVVDRLT